MDPWTGCLFRWAGCGGWLMEIVGGNPHPRRRLSVQLFSSSGLLSPTLITNFSRCPSRAGFEMDTPLPAPAAPRDLQGLCGPVRSSPASGCG